MQHAPTFGEWLKQRRRARDLTMDALAQRVGCSAATIEKIEANLRRPSRQIAGRLAAALNIPAAMQAAVVQHARGLTAASPSALPSPLTPLIGRDAEIARLVQQFQQADARLLTLVGPPGVGKTRLALAVAARLEPELPDGARFIALAGVSDATLVLDAIAQASDLPEQPGTAPLDRLTQAFQQRRMLLVLDNFEQVLSAAPQISALLTGCPLLQVLVTSRERLNLRGERVVAVSPLALPPAEANLDAIGRAPAVALFVNTAQAADRAFHLDATNAPQVATICAQLDGLPLAIEIVAAQSDVSDPAALLGWLDARRRLHQAGPRDLPERQRTLHAALDASYARLEPAEQQLFRRLGACANGWTLDAAAALDDRATPAMLQALVRKQLVQQQPHSAAELGYAMLETVRDYARAQLDASADAATTRQQHAVYYRTLAEQARPHLRDAAQTQWVPRLAQAHDNFQTALAWLLDQHAFAQAGELVLMLQRFWWMRGTLWLGRRWIGRMLAYRTLLPDAIHAELLTADAMLASAQGQRTEAVATLEQALVLIRAVDDAELLNTAVQNLGMNLMHLGQYQQAEQYFAEVLQRDRETGEPWDVAIGLGSLGDVQHVTGAYATARAFYEESLGIYRTLGDAYSIALMLNNLGEVVRLLGEPSAAQHCFDEALQITRAQGFQRMLPYMLNNLGALALAQGDADRARRCLSEALDLQRDVGDLSALATSLMQVAAYALAAGQPEHAVQVLAAAEALRLAQQLHLAASEQAVFAALTERVRVGLGDAVFAEAWAAGRGLGPAVATQLAQRVVQAPVPGCS